MCLNARIHWPILRQPMAIQHLRGDVKIPHSTKDDKNIQGNIGNLFVKMNVLDKSQNVICTIC